MRAIANQDRTSRTRRRWAAAVLVGSVLVLALMTHGAAQADDAADMAATWRVVSLVTDGNKGGEDDVRKITVENEIDGRWTLRLDGEFIAKGTSVHHEDVSPRQVELTITEAKDGSSVGQVFKGIYENKEKTRRVCLAPPGRQRPTKFLSAPGSGHLLVNYERVE